MIYFSWHSFIWAALVSLPAAGLFFAGLAWSVGQTLRFKHPAGFLLASFVVRSVLLVLFVYWLTLYWHPLSAIAGFSCAFLGLRWLSVVWIKRSGAPASLAKETADAVNSR